MPRSENPQDNPPETPYHREPGYALRYRDRRFTTGHGPATDRRERRAIRALLQGAGAGNGPWLDVPCGAGRFRDTLPAGSVLGDRALPMLQACGPGSPRVCASAARLPFPDRSFAGVLCLRLLQHISDAGERVRILTEIRRVSRGPVIVSFFDAASLQHWRRRLRRALGKPRSGRSATPRATILAETRAAGLEPRRLLALRRYISEQTLLLAFRR